MAVLVLLPVPFALAGSDVASATFYFLAGCTVSLILANLVSRVLKNRIPFLFFAIALAVTGLALGIAFPRYVLENGELHERYWPVFFRGIAVSIGLAPLAAYERVPWARRGPGRRRNNPPRG